MTKIFKKTYKTQNFLMPINSLRIISIFCKFYVALKLFMYLWLFKIYFFEDWFFV